MTSPLTSIEDLWAGQPWWRKVGPEPVDIHEYAGERVIDHSRHHWCVPLVNMVKMSAEMLVVGALSVGMAVLPFSVLWLQVTMVLCSVGHQCWMSRHILRWRADLIIVTNWRLISTGGILSTGVHSYRWDTVGNCFRDGSPLGKLFGSWNVRIVQNGGVHDTGAAAEYFPRVPRRIARMIESRASRPAAAAAFMPTWMTGVG